RSVTCWVAGATALFLQISHARVIAGATGRKLWGAGGTAAKAVARTAACETVRVVSSRQAVARSVRAFATQVGERVARYHEDAGADQHQAERNKEPVCR